MNKIASIFGSFVLAVAVFPVAYADGPPIPQEAFDACTSLKSGDACTVKMPDREVQGLCTASSDRGLFCKPEGPPPPPPEAFDACVSLKAGDACTAHFGDHEVKGTCEAWKDQLACRPDGPPPPRRSRDLIRNGAPRLFRNVSRGR